MNTKLAKIAIVGLSLIAAIGSVSAAGLLGERFVGAEWVTLDSQDKDVKSFYGGNTVINVPVISSVDASLSYGHIRMVQEEVEFKSTDIAVGVTYHEAFENTNDKLKLFIGGDVGNNWIRAQGFGQKIGEKSWTWVIYTGVEYEVVKDLSVSVEAAYARAPEYSESGTNSYSARANYWVTKQVGATAAFSINDDSDRLIQVGLAFRL